MQNLKSMIGLQKLELEKVKLQSDDIIDMNHFEIIEEDGKLKRIYNS